MFTIPLTSHCSRDFSLDSRGINLKSSLSCNDETTEIDFHFPDSIRSLLSTLHFIHNGVANRDYDSSNSLLYRPISILSQDGTRPACYTDRLNLRRAYIRPSFLTRKPFVMSSSVARNLIWGGSMNFNYSLLFQNQNIIGLY